MEPVIAALDIETDTSGGGGLDPSTSAVTTVAVAASNGAVFARSADPDDEVDVIGDLMDFFMTLPTGSIVVTWNGASFDAPFLHDRAGRYGLDPVRLVPSASRPPKYQPLPGHQGGYRVTFGDRLDHVDLSYLYRAWADRQGVRWSLKPVAEANGISMIETDASRVHDLADAARTAYCLSDAAGTLELARKLSVAELENARDGILVPLPASAQ